MRRLVAGALVAGDGLVPAVGRLGGDARHEVGIVVAPLSAQAGEPRIGRLPRQDGAHHNPGAAQSAGDRAGIDAAEAGHTLLREEPVERHRAQGVAGRRVVLPDDEPRDLHAARLEVALVDAVVADQRVRRHDDLPGVRRVGQHLLVAGHGGVEDDLAEGVGLGAERAAGVRRAVFEDEVGWVSHFRTGRNLTPTRLPTEAQTLPPTVRHNAKLRRYLQVRGTGMRPLFLP